MKVIIFDADGMTIKAPGYGAVQALEKAGIDPSLRDSFFAESFPDCLRGKVDLKKILKPELEKWGWKKGVDQFLQEWYEYEDAPDKQVIDFAQSLRRQEVFCCLASDNEKYRANYIKKEMGFENYFDELYFSYDIGYLKTEIEYWQQVFENLQEKINDLQKQEVVFWDNDVENVEKAKEFGFAGEIYKDFEDFKTKI